MKDDDVSHYTIREFLICQLIKSISNFTYLRKTHIGYYWGNLFLVGGVLKGNFFMTSTFDAGIQPRDREPPKSHTLSFLAKIPHDGNERCKVAHAEEWRPTLGDAPIFELCISFPVPDSDLIQGFNKS